MRCLEMRGFYIDILRRIFLTNLHATIRRCCNW